MNMPNDELSLEFIESLEAERPTRQSRTAKDTRDVTSWFKAYHTGDRNCEVKAHNESRPRNKGMCTIVNDIAVCRICFLASLDKS
jgi:hypothetical protein